MEAIELIKSRRSVRQFKDEVVSEEVMRNIMDSARFAPSWGNFQVARYTLVSDKEVITKLANDGVNDFVYNIGTLKNAKNVAVLSFVKGKSGKLEGDDYATSKANAWEVFDAGIACQTFCLSAHAFGVGTCIMGVIDEKSISEIVDLPKDETVAALIVYGYPEAEVKATPRKDVDEITRFI
ncbi:MAG: nitroreductase family protein [Pleomorphochaeta sp.]